MSLSHGPDFARCIGIYLDGLGFTVPPANRVADDPLLLEAWKQFATRFNLDLSKWPRPDIRALSMPQAVALDAVYVTQTDLVAADDKRRKGYNQQEKEGRLNQIARDIRTSSQTTAMYEHLKAKQEKLGVAKGLRPITDFMTEADHKAIHKAGKKKYKTAIAALSNDPKAR